MSPQVDLLALITALLLTGSLMLTCMAIGLASTRLLDIALGPAEEALFSLAVGLVGLWLIVVAFGHAQLLTRPALGGVLGVGVLAGLGQWRTCVGWASVTKRRVQRSSVRERVLAMLLMGTLALLLVSGTRAPGAQDELDYHWAAPVQWATAEQWIELPLRLTTGPVLAEHLYTVAAVFESPTTAHWLHSVFFVLLVVATALLARRFGGSALVAAAAVTAVPALLTQASLAYNDIAFAAFAVSAALLALTASTQGAYVLTGVLAGASMATKPVAVVFLVALLIVVRCAKRVSWREVLTAGAGAAAVVGVTLLHAYLVTGDPIPSSDGAEIARFEDEPLASGRIPTPSDVLIAPAMPVYASIVGTREPYGGRTGPVMALGLLAVVAGLTSAAYRHSAGCVIAGLALVLILVNPVVTRTRFHGVTWALIAVAMGVLASVGPKWARGRPATGVFVLAVCVGLADGARVIIRPW